VSEAIVKRQQVKPDFDAFVAAMFLMFARAPRKPEPDVDGFFELGEIGDAPEKVWTRLTPYSIARKEAHGHQQASPHGIIDIQPAR